MTDHGGAASPRTPEAMIDDAIFAFHRYAAPLAEFVGPERIGILAALREAGYEVRPAQEAPAPEGRCVHCGEARDAGVHDTAETCDAVRGPCLDPGRHHPYRAEARPPEGLDPDRLARALDKIEKGIATRYPGATYPSQQKAAAIAAEYARLSAGGAE